MPNCLRLILGLLILTSAALSMRAENAGPVVHMLVPGFTVEELPIELSNQNNLRFDPDGKLTSLGYDGRVWRLRDTNGDGLEDTAEPIWDQSTISVPLGMIWSTAGLLVSSHGKVSLLRDTNGDGKADKEDVIASGWPASDVASGGVDATAVTLDKEGNVYFGLVVADYSNAYRLRKRKELRPDEVKWLADHHKSAQGDPEEFVSLYDITSKRGTIQKFDPRTKLLTTLATGIRVPCGLAFNGAGDLFNTDQEGETWMPNGNPVDELNHIIPGRNYGFPPASDKWLPGLVSTAPVVGFGPQHQSTCGFVFNEPSARASTKSKSDVPLPVSSGQSLFGPKEWTGDAIVAGESRGKIWRAKLTKTPGGYVGKEQIIARIGMLVTDVTISPKGSLYVSCHSGPPDWGTGPKGPGKIFKITYTNRQAPQPIAVYPTGPTEVRVTFNQPLDSIVTSTVTLGKMRIEFGEYARAADRFEKLKPPYAVVPQQDATPRGHLSVLSARITDKGRTLVLTTTPHPLPVTYALTIPGIKRIGYKGSTETVDVDYDLTQASQPNSKLSTPSQWHQLVSWAPAQRASSGTDSRMPAFAAGDWEEGRGLFFGQKLLCSTCHRIRGEGATVGPDLSNLVHRDYASVLRDVRDPNATLHPDYVAYRADLKDGESLTGFVRAEAADTVRLIDVAGHETIIPRGSILNLHPTGESLMPKGLLDTLSEGEIRNLMTFLLREPVIRSRAEINSIPRIFKAPPSNTLTPMRVVLIASKQDHGPGQHDYPAWQTKWSRLLATLPQVAVSTAWEWPSTEQFATNEVLVFYYWNHDWSAARLAQIDQFQQRGGGIVLIHSAVISDKDPEKLAERFGMAAQPDRVKYRHTSFDLHLTPNHPLTASLPANLAFLDEPYWPLIGDPKQVTVLASAEMDGTERPLVWTFEHGKGRVFASIPGHYSWTLDDPFWRMLCVRGMAWAGNRDISTLHEMTVLEHLVK